MMFGLRGIFKPKVRWFVPVSFPLAGVRGIRGWFNLGGSKRSTKRTARTQPVRVTVRVKFND